ncbi:hypothetical protein C8R45DRAFT_941827 [Mycena sanguinolenta]|nr:hypothetical protein C8R45DRAFT_941827 [Mycena sanguinolenta]
MNIISTYKFIISPEERFPDTTGLSALVEFLSEEAFKAAAFLGETMPDPAGPPTGHMRAFRTDCNMFQWFEKPENKNRPTRFGIAMKGSAAEEPAETIFRGFKGQDLPADSIIVNVGGGLGASSLSIVKKYPTLKVVNEDRPPVMEQSKAHWEEFFPEYVKARMVEFQPHNFLEPQPVKNAAVIVENIVQSAGSGESTHPHLNSIPMLGVPRKPAAPPLLANFGMAGAPLYSYDLTMNNVLGREERTPEGFYDVLLQSC